MFTILRHAKHKMGSLSAAYNHNTRQLDSEFDFGNIDHEKSGKNLNFDFYPGDSLQEKIHARIESLDKSIPVPKIKQSGSKNDTVVAVEVLLTASPEFFENADQPLLDDWINTNIRALKERYGENLIHASVHLDETSPHIHAFYTPITQKLKVVKASKQEREDYESNKATAEFLGVTPPSKKKKPHYVFDAKNMISRANLQKAQDFFADVNQRFGLKRGVKKAELMDSTVRFERPKHIPPKKHREKLALEINDLEVKRDRLSNHVNELAKKHEIERQKNKKEINKLNVERNNALESSRMAREELLSLSNDKSIIENEISSLRRSEERIRELVSKGKALYFNLKDGKWTLKKDYRPYVVDLVNKRVSEALEDKTKELKKRELEVIDFHKQVQELDKLAQEEISLSERGRFDREIRDLKHTIQKQDQKIKRLEKFEDLAKQHGLTFEKQNDNSGKSFDL